MTAEDCLNIADYAHMSRRYTRMEQWAKEAERIYENEPNRIGNVTKLAIYEVLGWISYLVSCFYLFTHFILNNPGQIILTKVEFSFLSQENYAV